MNELDNELYNELCSENELDREIVKTIEKLTYWEQKDLNTIINNTKND